MQGDYKIHLSPNALSLSHSAKIDFFLYVHLTAASFIPSTTIEH